MIYKFPRFRKYIRTKLATFYEYTKQWVQRGNCSVLVIMPARLARGTNELVSSRTRNSASTQFALVERAISLLPSLRSNQERMETQPRDARGAAGASASTLRDVPSWPVVWSSNKALYCSHRYASISPASFYVLPLTFIAIPRYLHDVQYSNGWINVTESTPFWRLHCRVYQETKNWISRSFLDTYYTPTIGLCQRSRADKSVSMNS